MFLAGGITDCPDWQRDLVLELHSTNLTVYNPRRANFPIGDPSAAQEQIAWEHERLHVADAVSFWFPCETLCPIVLFELGAALERHQHLVVGVHEQYPRRQDVEVQCGLQRDGMIVMVGWEAYVGMVLTIADEMAWRSR